MKISNSSDLALNRGRTGGDDDYTPRGKGRPCVRGVHGPTRASRRVDSACGSRAFYNRYAAEFSNATVNLNLQKLYTPFLTELPPGSQILDAGCGSGRDTKAFLEKGYQVKGIDISPKMARFATEFTGQHCDVVAFKNLGFHNEFDGIWACASLLHVPHVGISDVLNRFAIALKPKGVLYVSLKEGHGEIVTKEGLPLSYYSLGEFSKEIVEHDHYEIIQTWKSRAVNSSGKLQVWLNFLARKVD